MERLATEHLFPLVALGLAACQPPTYPGESLGTFEVHGTLVENSCGTEAFAAVDPLRFPVELRDDEGIALWRRHRAPLMAGTVEEDGSYRFVFQTEVAILPPDPNLGAPGCTLRQAEEVLVRLVEAMPGVTGDLGPTDAGVSAALMGQNTIALSPRLGGDCTRALAVGGGPFLALPCRVHYDVTGVPREPF